MINFSFNIKTIKKDTNRSIFEIEPLYPGYGVTIGNSLRRVLLSSIEGAAITQVKIRNVASEFTTIPGVKEDTLEITLNLKKIKLSLNSEESQKIEIKESGEKEIKAGDIKTPPQVEIINKDLHIASLTQKNAKLEMEMTVEKGLGYVLAEKLKQEKSDVGVVYLDAIFTPVQKVAFTVENTMFEKRADYNKLKIDVETDGSIKPEEVFEKALSVLIDHLNSIQKSFGVKIKGKKKAEKEGEKNLALEDLKISDRTLKLLNEAGIKSLEGLLRKKEKSITEIKGMGEKAVKEIKRKLKSKDLELK
ncbi:MAG: DNA-directed RNA polymerase subunit alpha [Candidatus Pacebacteria bacterium]|jgi:DNA-directed RNA polymerase subunit alpha|nr:DNA-directed RNA polymerase subunit alpha [Candidatus Paceibacterota bacterium]